MTQRALRYVAGGFATAAIVGFALSFTVKEGRAFVVTRFGSPVRVVADAGPHLKAPWPIDRVSEIDMRRRVLSTPQTELLTRDKKNIVLMTSAAWRPADPLAFYRSVGTVDDADDKLIGLVTNAEIAVFGKYDLAALVSTDETTLQVDAIEEEILGAVNEIATGKYGIEVISVGFRRVSLPEQNVPYVLEQMRAERRQHAAAFRAEGELEAARIRSEADLTAARIRATGEEHAARIRGEAEAEAARIYAASHGKDPEFYRFIRSLESLDRIVGDNANVTLRTDAAPLRLLKESVAVEPSAGVEPSARRKESP
ncbi:MAG: protease modulator HflC [Myxococcota bacterium]